MSLPYSHQSEIIVKRSDIPKPADVKRSSIPQTADVKRSSIPKPADVKRSSIPKPLADGRSLESADTVEVELYMVWHYTYQIVDDRW